MVTKDDLTESTLLDYVRFQSSQERELTGATINRSIAGPFFQIEKPPTVRGQLNARGAGSIASFPGLPPPQTPLREPTMSRKAPRAPKCASPRDSTLLHRIARTPQRLQIRAPRTVLSTAPARRSPDGLTLFRPRNCDYRACKSLESTLYTSASRQRSAAAAAPAEWAAARQCARRAASGLVSGGGHGGARKLR